MDPALFSHHHLFKHIDDYQKVSKKPKELVVEYQKLIDINLEPIKNYKSHLNELIKDTKKLEIEYKEFYNFFHKNFKFQKKVEEKFFKNKIWTHLNFSSKDANTLFSLAKTYSARMIKIEKNYIVHDDWLWSNTHKLIKKYTGRTDDDFVDLNFSKVIEDAFDRIMPYGKIKGIFTFEGIDAYEAKFKIDRENLVYDLYPEHCTKQTVSFFSELLNAIFRVSTPVPSVLSEKGARKNYQGRVEYYEKQKRACELILRRAKVAGAKMENVGYVYIMSNESLPPNTYKIGSTYGLPEVRAEELTGTGHLTPFIVVGKIKIKSAEYFEKLLHRLLNNYRVRKDREYFELDLKNIKNILKQVSELSDKGEKKLTLSDLKKRIKK